MKTVSADDFDALYRQYGPMVLRRCRYLLKDEDNAVDAMQDVFLRVFERKEKVTSICSSFFYIIATRVCLNKIRSERYTSGGDMEKILLAIEDNTSSMSEDIIDAKMVLDCIFSDQKDSKTREIATLHFVDGLTLAETAKAMKMSLSGVRKRLDKLRANAKEKF